MDVARIVKRLCPERLERFRHVWDLTFHPLCDGAESTSLASQSSFSAKHASSLCEHDVAAPALGPGPV